MLKAVVVVLWSSTHSPLSVPPLDWGMNSETMTSPATVGALGGGVQMASMQTRPDAQGVGVAG